MIEQFHCLRSATVEQFHGLRSATARLRRSLVGAFCASVLGLLAPMSAGAAAVPEADALAVRKLVEAQLDAFAAGDAKRAYSYASASIQAQFGDAARFMAMVRGSYPMVVRPAAATFFMAQADDPAEGGKVRVRQTVQLRDSEGCLWMAIYLLARQAGAGWRIDGCVVVPDSGQSLT